MGQAWTLARLLLLAAAFACGAAASWSMSAVFCC